MPLPSGNVWRDRLVAPSRTAKANTIGGDGEGAGQGERVGLTRRSSRCPATLAGEGWAVQR